MHDVKPFYGMYIETDGNFTFMKMEIPLLIFFIIIFKSDKISLRWQINLSYCAISDMALCVVMGNLTRLQEAKLVHLSNVTVEGFVLALRACCVRIKKVKLLAPLKSFLSPEILETLHARGCIIRWD